MYLHYDKMNHGIKFLAGKLKYKCLYHKNLSVDEINPTVFDLSQWKRK